MQELARVLEAIAEANERLLALSGQMRSRPEVVKATHMMDFRRFSNLSLAEDSSVSSLAEFFVEAELKNGKVLCWQLEIQWTKDKLTIESAVLVNDETGRIRLGSFQRV